MNKLTHFALMGALALVAAVSCKSDKPRQIAPAKGGERNESCFSKNDCGSNLSCINNRCTPTDFDLLVTGKECMIEDCTETADCCGDVPVEAPAKCNGYTAICETPYLDTCEPYVDCTSNAECGGATCGNGSCSASGVSCDTSADCAVIPNTCFEGVCSADDADCSVNSCAVIPNTCENTNCGPCLNPEYNPADPICTDPDCEDVCTLICEGQRCMEDTSCEDDTECFGLTPFCDAGRCVECKETTDCDVDNDEACTPAGICEKPCTYDQECDYYEVCTEGECIYEGCKTNTDCILDPSLPQGADGRLAECRPGKDGFGVCRLPCENDSQCNETESCETGFCEYIGCENNGQCDRLFGLNGQDITPSRPYVSKGVCEAPVVAE